MRKVVPVDHCFNFIGTDLGLKGLREASWKCCVRLIVQKEWGEIHGEVVQWERSKERGGGWRNNSGKLLWFFKHGFYFIFLIFKKLVSYYSYLTRFGKRSGLSFLNGIPS